MSKEIFRKIRDITEHTNIVLCGSVSKNWDCILKYQAYYTLQGNIVHIPVNYELLSDSMNWKGDKKLSSKTMLKLVHRLKIKEADVVIVLFDDDCYTGQDTLEEMLYAFELGKTVLTNKPNANDNISNKDNCFPLYLFEREV